jgi:hypothetical protein
MKKTKFDLLFENIMSSIQATDAEVFGNDIYLSTLKVFKLTDKGFTNLIYEIDNFEFLEPDSVRGETIADLKVDEENVDIDFELCKIMVFEKKSNELKFECITFLGDDSNEIIDLISYNENPRGNFEGVSETLYEEDSDSFDETYKAETIEYRDHFINIETFDDQGDIVYVWSITSKKDNNTFSDEKYYNSIKSALDNAKAEIDFKIDGIKPIIASEPKCPYCGRKVNRDGLFYYSCIEHGKIHKHNIKK